MIRKLRQRKARNEKGFTLIELMIVIAIIGILAAIAIPNFLAYRTRGQDSAAQAEAKNFYTCAVAYFSDTVTVGTTVTADTSFGGHNVAGDVIPLYNDDPNVTATSSVNTLTDDLDGTITLDPTTGIVFSHTASSSSFTLDEIGNVE